MDLSTTTEPRSDQQNFDDYASGITRIVTIEKVTAGNAEQPVVIHLVEFPGRPYKPSKSMRRVLVAAWGKDTSPFGGRKMELYGDPEVKFGGERTGGIKIKALSHIDKPLSVSLTVTRGKRAPHVVQPLAEAPAPTPAVTPTDQMIAAYESLGVTRQQLEAHVALPVDEWTPEVLAALKELGRQIKNGETSVAAVFGVAE